MCFTACSSFDCNMDAVSSADSGHKLEIFFMSNVTGTSYMAYFLCECSVCAFMCSYINHFEQAPIHMYAYSVTPNREVNNHY